MLLATLRIVATYSVFSHTSDEPAHVACGMEWLDRGAYKLEAQHPPLARVAGALGPFLQGGRYHGMTGYRGMYREGLEIFYEGQGYDSILSAARMGILPFFWLAAWTVYLWARRDFGVQVALAALLFFTFLPPVLAHAGLATTDMALTACLGAAFLTGRNWLERPTAKSGAIFGACGALAMLSKFSSLPYFAAAAGLALVGYAVMGGLAPGGLARAAKDRLPSLGVAVGVAAAIVWAMYRFSFGKTELASFPLPAPEFFNGIRDVIRHNQEGHLSYLLGHVSRDGFRGFYFVVLAVKTPISYLLLAGIGAVWLKRRTPTGAAWLLPLAYAGGIVLVSFFSRINIGVRHILPIYTALSIVAAVGLVGLLERRNRQWAVASAGVLLLWMAGASVLAHPDYLPYFNELAGSHPEKILVDSDLDWGQDMKRLETRLQKAQARLLAIGTLFHFSEHAKLPAIRLINPETPTVGWTALSLTMWKQYRLNFDDREPNKVLWPDQYPPQEIVGKSIALWHFPPSSGLPLQ